MLSNFPLSGFVISNKTFNYIFTTLNTTSASVTLLRKCKTVPDIFLGCVDDIDLFCSQKSLTKSETCTQALLCMPG